MRAVITTIGMLVLFVSHLSYGETAVRPNDIFSEVQASDFQFSDRGRLTGYISLESCLWASGEILLIRHYCYDRQFPARAFTLMSRRFGVVYLYEEALTADIVKRDLVLDQFPEWLNLLWDGNTQISVPDLNVLRENLYQQYNPACWSTSFDVNKRGPVTDCLHVDIQEFPDWEKDASSYVNTTQKWDQLFSLLMAKAPIVEKSDIEY